MSALKLVYERPLVDSLLTGDECVAARRVASDGRSYGGYRVLSRRATRELQKLVDDHRSLAAAARSLDVRPSHLNKVLQGDPIKWAFMELLQHNMARLMKGGAR
jgi:hypothetical protein